MRALAAVLTLLAAFACSPDEARTPRGAPHARASVVVEPRAFSLGQVGRVDVAVVTPPGQRVAPLTPPSNVPGIWILDWQADAPEQQAERWLHRVHFRVRAREVGAFEWPALRLELEGPRGERTELETEPQTFRVASELEAQPRRTEPYGLRDLPRPLGWRALAVAAAGGAAAALLAMAAFVLVRTRRARAPLVPPAAFDARDPVAAWHEAQRELAIAETHVRDRPGRAAELGAGALRRYVVDRFGVEIGSRSTEELARARAPLALATRWGELVTILRALDGLRFRDREQVAHEPGAQTCARDVLARARGFVLDTAPQQARS